MSRWKASQPSFQRFPLAGNKAARCSFTCCTFFLWSRFFRRIPSVKFINDDWSLSGLKLSSFCCFTRILARSPAAASLKQSATHPPCFFDIWLFSFFLPKPRWACICLCRRGVVKDSSQVKREEEQARRNKTNPSTWRPRQSGTAGAAARLHLPARLTAVFFKHRQKQRASRLTAGRASGASVSQNTAVTIINVVVARPVGHLTSQQQQHS